MRVRQVVEKIVATSTLLTTLALSLSLEGCGKGDAQPALVQVTRGDLVADYSFYGELVPKKTISVTVPKVPRVDSLTLTTVLADGTPVKAGDVVATFDTTELEDDLRVSESELLIAQAERDEVLHGLATEKIGLELDQKRRQMAVEEAKLHLVEGVNLISELERKKAEVNLRSAEVELKLAASALVAFAKKRETALGVQDIKVKTTKQQVDDYRGSLGRLEVKSPADGVVYRPFVTLNYSRAKAEPGRVCRAGDKFLELPDLSAFEVLIYMRPRDAARIQLGDEAKIHIVAAADRVLSAKVVRKDSFATTRNERYGTKTPEGNLKEIAVTFELSESIEGMRPGGTVRAELGSVLKRDTVLLPVYALTEEKGGKRFVTLESGEQRAVELGLATATHVEVLSGLDVGQSIAIRPRSKNEPLPAPPAAVSAPTRSTPAAVSSAKRAAGG